MSTDSTHTHLHRAPIVEALVEFGVELAPGFDFAKNVSSLSAPFGEEYPGLKRLFSFEAGLQMEDEGLRLGDAAGRLAGHAYWSADQKQVAQIKLDSFAFNRLAPYEGLDAYSAEIRKCWAAYQQLLQPVSVRRIALRFINKIMLPLGGKNDLDLALYLVNGPKLAEPESFLLEGFLHQHLVVEQATGLKGRILLTIEPPSDGCIPLIFDIEVFKAELRVEPDAEQIWSILQDLRGLKNRLFLQNLTEKCLNLFH